MAKRFVNLLHLLLNILQVLVVVTLLQLGILVLALPVALVGKWRILSFNPHRLWRNLRSNSCDMIVISSLVLLMNFYELDIVWFSAASVLLAAWLLFIKPASSAFASGIQAMFCQFFGVSALWLVGVEEGLSGLIALPALGLISYVAARHTIMPLISEDGADRRVIPLVWAVFMTQLGWLTWLWSITYRLPGGLLLPQISLLAVLLGYFASHHLYRFKNNERRLPLGFIWQQLFFGALALVAIIFLTPWSNAG